MTHRRTATALAAFLLASALPAAALADNPMGYRLLSEDAAAGLPHNHGVVGLDIERARQISDDGMVFDLIRVKQARRNSPGAQAGLKAGDEIIAVDGRVFASLMTFGAYVGSLPPGTRMKIDYIPAGGGPQQAQRVTAIVGAAGQAPSQGLSTGEKVAIGVGAAALLGCYELGCFNHHPKPAPAPNAAH